MRISTNIASLAAQRRLSDITRAFGRSLERLSSGQRINRAGDDPAGLAISEGLKSEIIGLARGARNINDARSILNTAESALATQVDMVQRMRELALQSSNGVISNDERAYLNTELQQLFAEYNRLVDQTDFNGLSLLAGELSNMEIQVGANSGEAVNLSVGDASASEVFTKAKGQGIFEESEALVNNTEFSYLEDLNNDGRDDLVFVADTTIKVRLGEGNGSFGAEILSDSGGSYNTEFNFNDLNGDGFKDLIVETLTRVDIAYNNGDGSFSDLQRFHTAVIGATILTADAQAADFDQDGFSDIAVQDGSGGLMLYFGDAEGNFNLGQTYAAVYSDQLLFDEVNLQTQEVQTTQQTMDLVDFDGDGDIDIVDFGSRSLRLNDGDGTFTTAETWSSGFYGLTGDFDGDGRLDLFRFNISNNTSQVMLQQEDGSLGPEIDIELTGDERDFDVADLNNDGIDDLIHRNEDEEVYSLIALGDGTFRESFITDSVDQVLLSDQNDDGVLDLIHTTSGGTRLSLQSTSQVNGTDLLDIRTQEDAQVSLRAINSALDNLIALRSQLGAQSNRLASAYRSNLLAVEDLEASRSQILDTDIAQETAELTKNQILQQAATSVLAQANSNLQLVLSLLQN